MRIVENTGTGERLDALAISWCKFINHVLPKAILMPIPNNIELVKKMINDVKFKGFILSGGNDLGSEPGRDEVEFYLIEQAIKFSLPLFGVCRGLQVINVFFGGGLNKKKETDSNYYHAGSKHPVALLPNLGLKLSQPEFVVNSYHNQYVTQCGLADNLEAFALSENDIVEGLFHNKYPIMGVQWHPERYSNIQEMDSYLFEKLFLKEIFRKK